MTVRALTSGVTGMLTNQISMDVTANNLANVNTPGFKGSRVMFSNNLVQTTFAGSAPGASIGGQNPQQVGLGVQAASIDVDMRQGALQSTGRTLDLAIQGDGFFEVTDGTRSQYTRVGNFGLDANNDMVLLGSGMRLIGDVYNLEVNPDGSQSIAQVSTPINMPVEDAFPPRQTSSVEMKGNLSSADPALRGSSVQSLYQLRSALSGLPASEGTLLRNLTTFNEVQPIPAPDSTVSIFIFGTKPDGSAYSGSFDIHPWASPTSGSNRGSVAELVEGISSVLTQGTQRFGTIRIDNGSLIASGIGEGDAFSIFMGEGQPNYDLSGVDPVRIPGAINPTSSLLQLDASIDPVLAPLNQSAASPHVYDPADSSGPGGTNPTGNITVTIPSSGPGAVSGLVEPIFYPTTDVLANPVRVSVRINGVEYGTLTIPAANYDSDGIPLEERSFSLKSLPHLRPGDELSYVFTGLPTTPGGVGLGVSTHLVNDADSANLTADVFGGSANGLPDMFEENSPVDPNAWQYRNESNATFDFYQFRMVPDFVSTSIEVFDAQGGSHILETRFFRTGTRTDPATGARYNIWDAIVSVPHGDGEIIDNVVAGIEFDQNGRFTGSVGTSAHGTTFNSSDFRANPSVPNVQIDWGSTGPTVPGTIQFDMGQPNSYSGLTGFGTASTASSIDQDGYTDGRLDTLSVSAEGDISAIYSNGISRLLANIPVSTFRNPAGLENSEGSLWTQTTSSGNPIRRAAGQNAGFIASGALEQGNVDIATEFSRMIISQRGFQVSARVIQTTDQMLEELANLLR